MNPWKILLAALLIVFASACSTTRNSFSPTECNEAAAYDRGYSEGSGGLNPETQYSYGCREDLRDAVRKGYRTGYDKGHAEYKERMAKWEAEGRMSSQTAAAPVAVPAAPQPQYYCEITYSGRGFQAEGLTLDEARSRVVKQCEGSYGFRLCNTLPTCKKDVPTASNKAIYCTLDVFNRHYDAFGPTELETRVFLKKSCAQGERSDFFCKEEEMKCRPNQ